MCVYISTTSCHFSSLPYIFAVAHMYNRALYRDDIMQCFEGKKKKIGVKVFILPMGNVSYVLQQITAWRQNKLFVILWC